MLPDHVTATLVRGPVTVVFKGIPALVCDNCGEQFVSQLVTSRLLTDADSAIKAGVQVEVRQYGEAA